MKSPPDDLHFATATTVIDLYRTGELSPVEHMQLMIARAEKLADSVNPLADRYFSQALEQASRSEQRYMQGNAGSLEGVPLIIKDTSAIKGLRATVGSLTNADNVADYTDTVVKRLLDAGANFFARSTCPEFGWLFTCHSRMWGVTRNPWRLDITCGGSSGGSAAALAAGATTLATGSDSTGSIRQPAAQCGVVGYKSPYGRNPQGPSASFRAYANVGPMTRSVKDAALMQNVMSGHDPLDHCSLTERLVLPEEPGSVQGMKIAYSLDLGHYRVRDDVKRETLAVLDALRGAGAIVEECEINWASEAIKLAHLSEEFHFAGMLQKVVAQQTDSLSDYVPELLETATEATADDSRRAVQVAGEVWFTRLGPLLERYDALITPTVSCPEIPADNWQKQWLDPEQHQAGDPLLTDTDTAMTALFNMFNRCPVLSVPAGMTDSGLPVGVQIVARPYDDETVFHIGQAVELQRPWLDCPERRPVL